MLSVVKVKEMVTRIFPGRDAEIADTVEIPPSVPLEQIEVTASGQPDSKEEKIMLDIKRVVGPVMQSGEIAQAVIEAIREDNAPKTVEVQDRGSYIRISVEDECIINRTTVEEMMGRPFKMFEMEAYMSGFNGQIETSSDHIRFYMFGNA